MPHSQIPETNLYKVLGLYKGITLWESGDLKVQIWQSQYALQGVQGLLSASRYIMKGRGHYKLETCVTSLLCSGLFSHNICSFRKPNVQHGISYLIN